MYYVRWYDGERVQRDSIGADSFVVNEAGRLVMYNGNDVKKLYNKEVWLSVEVV